MDPSSPVDLTPTPITLRLELLATSTLVNTGWFLSLFIWIVRSTEI